VGVIAHFADCIVVTHDNKILLQQRPETGAHPGALCAFGGHVEDGETVIQAGQPPFRSPGLIGNLPPVVAA